MEHLAKLFKKFNWSYINLQSHKPYIPDAISLKSHLTKLEERASLKGNAEFGKLAVTYDKSTQKFEYYLNVTDLVG